MTTITSHVSVHDDASRLSRLSESSDSNSRPGFSYSGIGLYNALYFLPKLLLYTKSPPNFSQFTSHVSVHDDASRLSRLSESSDSNSRPGFSYSGMFYTTPYLFFPRYLFTPNRRQISANLLVMYQCMMTPVA